MEKEVKDKVQNLRHLFRSAKAGITVSPPSKHSKNKMMLIL